jgi:hypothetical protein
VAPSQRSCEDEVKDGRVDATDRVGSYYTYFTVFFVLDLMSIIVFCLDL